MPKRKTVKRKAVKRKPMHTMSEKMAAARNMKMTMRGTKVSKMGVIIPR